MRFRIDRINKVLSLRITGMKYVSLSLSDSVMFDTVKNREC